MRTVYTYLLNTVSLVLLCSFMLQAQPDCDMVEQVRLSYGGEQFLNGAVIEICDGGPDTLKTRVQFGNNASVIPCFESDPGSPDDKGSYNWEITSPDGGTSADLSSCTLVPTDPGVYTYTLRLVCQDNNKEATYTIVKISPPVLSVGNCNESMVLLQRSGDTEYPDEISRNWFEGNTPLTDNDNDPDNIEVDAPSGNTPVTYRLELGDCPENFAEITISAGDFDTEFTVTPQETTVCAEATTTVDITMASDDLSFSWSTGATGTSATVGVGDYSVTGTNMTSGCSRVFMGNIGTSNTPTRPTITPSNPPSLCPGETTELTVSGGGGGNLTYSWRQNNMEIATGTSFSAGPGTFGVVAINTAGCQSTASTKTVPQNDTHDPAIAPLPEPICQGDTVTLSALGAPTGTDISWSTGESGSTTDVFQGGDYSLSYSGGDLCDEAFDFTVPVFGTLPSLPTQPDVSVIDGEQAMVPISLGNAAGIQDINSADIEEINASLTNLTVVGGNTLQFTANGSAGNRATGAVRLLLRPVGDTGCVGEPGELLIRVVPTLDDLFIPELISPNGDGSNDRWAIVFPEDADAYDIVVYSRGGAVVFEGSGNQMPWDAGACPNGVYYYRISQRGPEGGLWQGALTIIGRDR